MVRKIIVVGGGSAGFMAALALKRKIPQLDVTVIRSKDIGIIGVGEGSAIPFTNFIHRFLGIDVIEFVQAVRPSWKLGTRFLWGSRDRFFFPFRGTMGTQIDGLAKPSGFYCADDMECASIASAFMALDRMFERSPEGNPLLHWDFAYHIENEPLAQYLEGMSVAAGVRIVDDTIRNVRQNEQGVAGLDLASGRSESGDLYVDCSGFASLLLGKTMREPFVSFSSTLACDRAIVGGWARERGGEPILPYTTAETMDAGWCWQIEHPNRINRGYVYSSAFITDDQAERELRARNPRVGPVRTVKFVSGRHERSWVKNVVAIGNASGFVEPLEATSLSVIGTRCQLLTEMLIDSDLRLPPVYAGVFNNTTARVWDSIRRFLALHYRFNTRLDTPFWRHTREHTDMAGSEPILEYYAQAGPSTYWSAGLVDVLDIFGVEGYLTLLIGQRVPHGSTYQPTERERAIWDAFRRQNRARAERAMSIDDAIGHVGRARPAPAPSAAPASLAAAAAG